ncbi:MAG: HAD family hydrolase [Thiohalomonadales bacterium]
MNQPEAVIFDMDGVLIDSHQCAYSVLVESLAKFNILITIEELKLWGSLSGKQFWKKVKRKYELTEDLDFLINSYDFEKEISYYEEIGLMSGVEKFIEMISRNGVIMGLATSAEMIRVNKVLSLGNIANKFSYIVSAEDVEKHKPNPECYIKICELLKVSPNQTLVIEDSNNGATAAKASGCQVAAFHGSMWQYDNFEADYHIESFNNINELSEIWSNKKINCTHYSSAKNRPTNNEHVI